MQAMKHAKRPAAKTAPESASKPAAQPPATPASTVTAAAAAAKKGYAPPPNKLPNPRLQADARWQRTQRYGWDKGGSRGGR